MAVYGTSGWRRDTVKSLELPGVFGCEGILYRGTFLACCYWKLSRVSVGFSMKRTVNLSCGGGIFYTGGKLNKSTKHPRVVSSLGSTDNP